MNDFEEFWKLTVDSVVEAHRTFFAPAVRFVQWVHSIGVTYFAGGLFVLAMVAFLMALAQVVAERRSPDNQLAKPQEARAIYAKEGSTVVLFGISLFSLAFWARRK